MNELEPLTSDFFFKMSGINEFKSILDTTLTDQSNDMCDVELNGKRQRRQWLLKNCHVA